MTPIEISILQQLTQKIIIDIEVLNDSDLIKELDIIWGLGTGGSGRDSSGNKTAFWGKGGTNPRFVFNPNGFNTHEKHPGVVILKGKKLLTMIRELTMTIQKQSSKYDWKIKGIRRNIENVIKQLGTLNWEISFEIKEEGINCKTVDGSHVAVMKLFWPNDSFEHYEIIKESTFTANNVNDIIHAMKTAGTNDIVSLQFNGTHLRIDTDNSGRNPDNQETILPNMEEKPGPKMPKLDDTENIEAPVNWFKEAIAGCARKSNLVEFSHDNENFVIKAIPDDELQNEVWKYSANIQNGLSNNANANETAMYSLQYLKRLAALMKTAKADNFVINFMTNYPLKMKWELQDGAKMEFFLAPRVIGDA